MKAAPTPSPLSQFDLLPAAFRYQNRIHQIYCGWLTVTGALIAILCGVTAATILRSHRTGQANLQIAITAVPLLELRREVRRMQEQSIQHDQWCQWVEAARPDDSALQTLAAVAAASPTGNQDVIIDSLHLRLPLEFPITQTEAPEWAMPGLAITARIEADGAQPWLDRLNRFDRIQAASIDAPDQPTDDDSFADVSPTRSSEKRPLQVTATPSATRVLP